MATLARKVANLEQELETTEEQKARAYFFVKYIYVHPPVCFVS